MTSKNRSLVAVVSVAGLVMAVQGCNCSKVPPHVVSSPRPVGDVCTSDSDCLSQLCAATPHSVSGTVCQQACAPGKLCPTNQRCIDFGTPDGKNGEIYACAPSTGTLCNPCANDSACGYPNDRCLASGATNGCGQDCSGDGTCPAGFSCVDATDVTGSAVEKQCVPVSGTCACTEATHGSTRPCQVSNQYGACNGVETCDPTQGFVGCTAPTPVDPGCTGQVCGADGGLIDAGFNLQSDPNNCGACFHKCSDVINGSPVCFNGFCGASCTAPFGDCDQDAGDGCETNLSNTLENCGACGNACPVVAHAISDCAKSTCTFTCTAPFDNCDDDAGNGCETNLNNNPNNCGGCGNRCQFANSIPSCVGGSCEVDCKAGFADCNGQQADGCEVNINTNANNCGGCGAKCSFPNAAASCKAGNCAMACNTGFGDCNNSPADGCEVNLTDSTTNCGSCGNKCSFANAAASCKNSSCQMKCNTGFADCNDDSSDGCEVNLTSNTDNCGSCGDTCSFANASGDCKNSSCELTACNQGFADCDRDAGNGCEVNTVTAVNNCGGCGNVCSFANAAASCKNSACQMKCDTGFADCDRDAGDGCEVNTTTAVDNCGACGNVCSFANATASCKNSACQMTCEPNFKDCNQDAGDGCESNITTDPDNCGGCGQPCSFNHASALCVDSQCQIGACATGFQSAFPPPVGDGGGCDCQFVSATDQPDLQFVDANCDGIDGEIDNAVFVDQQSGDDTAGDGGMAHPFKSVQMGIDSASTLGKRDVYLSKGVYDQPVETVELHTGVSVYGGYDAANHWQRSLSNTVTISGAVVPVDGNNVGDVVVQLLSISAANATLDGQTSIGMTLINASNIVLQKVNIQAGLGGPGANGSPGNAGADAATDGISAGPGQDAEEDDAFGCSNCTGDICCQGPFCSTGPQGGNGGTNFSCSDANGGAGGASAWGPSRSGNSGDDSPGGGGGGNAGQPNLGTSQDTAAKGHNGGNGTTIVDGSAGPSLGSLDASGYVPAPGQAGQAGQDGVGGGGGGGGGGGQGSDGVLGIFGVTCNAWGAGGGGGGAGGCGGRAGTPGQGGGASIGLFMSGSTVQAIECEINGGPGGPGGAGGAGGAGGVGAAGGVPQSINVNSIDNASLGGPGGKGGSGSRGGHAGGGGGGPSIGVAEFANISFTPGTQTAIAAGAGGLGGANAFGGTAAQGEEDQLLKL